MANDRKRLKKSRLGPCDVCQSVASKYTCPRCETVTCSLKCVKRHKLELDCDGIRVRTKYVPLDKMNELNLISDYRLLEDIERCVETAEKIRASIDCPEQEDHDVQISEVKPDNKESKPVVVSEKKTKCKKKRGKKGKKVNANASGVKKKFGSTKTDHLKAKANRIRQQILKKKSKVQSEGVNVNSASGCDDDKKDVDPKQDTVPSCSIVGNVTEPSSDVIMSDFSDVGSISPSKVMEASSEAAQSSESISVASSSDELKEKGSKLEQIANETTASTSTERNQKQRPPVEDRRRLMALLMKGGNKKQMILNSLKKAAFSRGTMVSFLPDNFEKHMENTSLFFARENCIYWRVKVSFIHAQFYTLNVYECTEKMVLEDFVRSCLKRSRNYNLEMSGNDPLVTYRKLGVSKITVLMAADKLENSQKKFYILDKKKSLQENFVGKCIVEFPHLCIALEGCHVVSKVQESTERRFFDFEHYSSSDEKFEERQEEVPRKKTKKKVNREEDDDRESGELTDSEESNSDTDDSESDLGSEEELYNDSEFRSMYKDLLQSFDVDVNQLHH